MKMAVGNWTFLVVTAIMPMFFGGRNIPCAEARPRDSDQDTFEVPYSLNDYEAMECTMKCRPLPVKEISVEVTPEPPTMVAYSFIEAPCSDGSRRDNNGRCRKNLIITGYPRIDENKYAFTLLTLCKRSGHRRGTH